MSVDNDEFVSIDTAAEEFKVNIDRFVAAYKLKHVATPDTYPISLPASNAGLWNEFMLDFHLSGTV